jgi:hypothetical protein
MLANSKLVQKWPQMMGVTSRFVPIKSVELPRENLLRVWFLRFRLGGGGGTEIANRFIPFRAEFFFPKKLVILLCQNMQGFRHHPRMCLMCLMKGPFLWDRGQTLSKLNTVLEKPS